jgi:hypothetical protein
MDPVLRDSPPIPTPSPVVMPIMPEAAAPADVQPLRWGPIWAGLLTAVGVFFMLTLVAVTLGLQAAPGVDAADEDVGFVAVLATSLIALVAFFVGGFVASWSAGLADQGRSLLNGFLVWALWLVAVIVLALLGLGSFVGAAGEVFGRVALDPAIDAAAVEGDELVSLVREGAWQTLLVLLLTAGAAALGGVLGARPELRGALSRVVVVRPRV